MGMLLGGVTLPIQAQGKLSAQTLPESQQDPLVRAEVLNQRVLELYQAGRYQEAIPLAEEALSIRREQLGDEHPNVATSLNNLAELYRLQGRSSEAESLFQESLLINRRQFGNRHLAVATNLDNIAKLFQSQGRYAEAEVLYKEGLSIRQEQLGLDHPAVARTLNNLAELYRLQGRYSQAELLFQESLLINRRQFGDRHPDVATTLNNLANLYFLQGRYEEASLFTQEALSIRQEQLGSNHPDTAVSLNNLAEVYRTQGNYQEAESLYQEFIKVICNQLGERHVLVTSGLNNLALLYFEQGRYEEGALLFQEALSIRREQLGPRHPDVAYTLIGLAAINRVQGYYEEAEALYHEALSIRQEKLGQYHPEVAYILNELAILYHTQGLYRAAEPLYQEARSIWKEQLGPRHPDIALSINNLALVYQAQERYEEAELLLEEAYSIWQEQLGERHPKVAVNLSNLASLQQAQGNFEQMLRYLKANLEIEEWNLGINIVTLTEAQRQDYIATLKASTNRVISLPFQTSDTAFQHLSLTTLLRRKGRLLEADSSSLQRLRQNLTPDDQAVLDNLVAVRQQISVLTFAPPTNVQPQQYREQLAQLYAKAEDLEKTLALRSAVFRVQREPVEIEAVKARIPTNGVLVEYFRYQPYSVAENSFGDSRYAVYLLFPDGRIEATDLGDAAEIDAAVQSFMRLLQAHNTNLQGSMGASSAISPDVVEQVTSNIEALIFDPIAFDLQDAEHLLISLDGQLNLLPFEALQTEAGGDYLVQQYQISYLNSGRDLLKFDVADPSQNPAVILADPDYEIAAVSQSRGMNGNSRSVDLSQLQFGQLPGTAAEASAIQPLLPNATVLLEAEATENVLKQVEAPRILHLATHGFFLEDVELPTSNSRGIGVIASEGTLLSTPGRGGVAVENPLLRSGLALAGFNTRSSGSEDGVLTALEASNLNLFGTQLVVLSACETGVGDIANGEGIYGLRRAFAIAGAESQLLSLWRVDDFGTQSLMARYYEKLTAGMGRSEALRAVQLEMIEAGDEYSHPFYWAAFILTGDWRPLEAL